MNAVVQNNFCCHLKKCALPKRVILEAYIYMYVYVHTICL